MHTTRSQRNLTKSRNCERANSAQRILYFDNTENYSWKMGWKMHIKPCLQKPLHAIECDKLWNEKRTIYSLSFQSKPVELAWFCGNRRLLGGFWSCNEIMTTFHFCVNWNTCVWWMRLSVSMLNASHRWHGVSECHMIDSASDVQLPQKYFCISIQFCVKMP